MPDANLPAPREVAITDLTPEFLAAHWWRLFPVNAADPGETRIEARTTFARLYGAQPELLVNQGLHLLAGPIHRERPIA